MLEDLITAATQPIRFYFRSNTIYDGTGEDLTKNLILIGAGTGIAPFIGLLEHRQYLQEIDPKKKRGTVWLMTGQRYSRDGANLFAGKFKSISTGVDKHFQSFSRDFRTKDQKTIKYVQDLIVANKGDFVSLFMEPETNVYVCGEGKMMAPDVERTIVDCLINVSGKFTVEEAKCLIVERKTNKTYVEDVWI